MPTHQYLTAQPQPLTSLPQSHIWPLLLPLIFLHQICPALAKPFISLSSLSLLTLAVYDQVKQVSLMPQLPIPATPQSLPAIFQAITSQNTAPILPLLCGKFHRGVQNVLKIKAHQAFVWASLLWDLMCRDFHPWIGRSTSKNNHVALLIGQMAQHNIGAPYQSTC